MKKQFILALALLLFSLNHAKFMSPWIVAPKVLNLYNIETLKNDAAFAGLSNDALFKAVHDTFYNGKYKSPNDQNHTYHFHYGDNNPFEPISATAADYEGVWDPIKYLNVYGFGYCGWASALMEGLAAVFGYEGRRWVVDNPGHSVPEVYYNGGWHYFDLDIVGWGADATGSVYSLDWVADNPATFMALPAAQTSASTIAKFFPQASNIGTSIAYNKTNNTWYSFHDCQQLGHDMSFSLRQGESLTRYWEIQNTANIITGTSWAVPTPNTVPAWGEGSMVYEPNLTSLSTDFSDGVYEQSGIVQTTSGLSAPAGGYCIFAVRVPYLISRFFLTESHSGSAAFQISKDLGNTWTAISSGEVAAAKAQYDFLIKCTLNAGAVLSALTCESIFMWNPATYPRLALGTGTTDLKLYKYDDTEELTYYGTPSFGQDLTFNAPATGDFTAISVQVRLQRSNPPSTSDVVAVMAGPSAAALAQVGINEQDTLGYFSHIGHGVQTINVVKYALPAGSKTACVRIDQLGGWANIVNATIRLYYRLPNSSIPSMAITQAYKTPQNVETEQTVIVNPADFGSNNFAPYAMTTERCFKNTWVRMAVVSDDGTKVEEAGIAGKGMGIEAYPNPFNPAVTISVGALRSAVQHMGIYDISGKCVADLSLRLNHGPITWDASSMPSGTYIIRLVSGGKIHQKPITLIK